MLWLASLAAALAMNGVQNDSSLLAKLVPVPTGRNGYEDFLRAGDLIGSNNWSVYEQWIGFKRNHLVLTQTDVEGDSDVPDMPPGVSPEMSELAVRKVANERFGGAYDVLKIGNGKQVWDPRDDLGMASLFPELSRFKTLAKIGINKAHVEFSEGRTTQAIDDLFDGITFSKHMYHSVLVSCLVGVAIQAIMLSEFNEHLGQLSFSDAELIDRRCSVLLSEKLSFSEVYKREAGLASHDLAELIKSPDLFLSDEDLKSFGQGFKDLGPNDQLKLQQMVTETLRQRFEAAQQRMGGDEADWLLSEGEMDPIPSPRDQSVSNLALLMANSLSGKDTMRGSAKAIAKGRIQLHLLQLHAKVMEYHWKNNQWPKKIEEFAEPKVAFDPFAKSPFHYELKDGGYRLYSLGVPGAGPIELKYHRLVTSGEGSGNP